MTTGRPLLVVVGSINRDVLITCDRLPGVGETVIGSGMVDARGGKGANQAAAAVIGADHADVALLGAVGDEQQGNVELEALESLGVDVDHVERVAGARTGTAFVAVDRRGSNQIIVVPGANGALSPVHVRQAIVRLAPRVVLASLEVPHAAVEAALQAAADVGATTVLNPAPAGDLRPGLLAACDVLTPNEVEFRQISGASDPTVAIDEETAPALLDRMRPVSDPQVLVITLGERGALIVDTHGARPIAAPRVEVVDTTGAGDVFNGVLAAHLAGSTTIDAAVGAAVATASRAIGSAGARLKPGAGADR